MRIMAVLPVFLLLLSGAAFAADPKMPEPLQLLGKQGAEIRYLGNDGGLDGWVTIKDGQEQYFYVTPDQQGIVLGVLFNNKGDVVTSRQIESLKVKDPAIDAIANPQQTPAPKAVEATAAPVAETKTETKKPTETGPSKSQQLFAEVEASSWIALGQKNAPAIYSFIDPQCPHCHDMINDFRQSGLLDKGAIQLRLVPVGLMNETSLKQAANLIASPNAPAALYKHMGGDTEALMTDPNPNTQNVQRNIALFQNWKLDVTPFSVYKDKTGTIKIIRGRPENLKALAAQLK